MIGTIDSPGRAPVVVRVLAVFEIDADLPSGNHMYGTVGPMIGANLAASIRLKIDPPSAEDERIARAVMDNQMGKPSDLFIRSREPAEHREAFRKVREFMGGGQG